MTDRRPRLLALYPVLAAIPERDLDKALKGAGSLRLRPGACLFEELQSCDAFPFVLSGKFGVVKRSGSGREIALYDVEAGDACVVSSACLLGKEPYNAMGLVKSDCELLMMPAYAFDQLMCGKDFRAFVFSSLSRRVLDLMLLVHEVAFLKLDQRMARLLLSRAPYVDVSHRRLADELGVARETITRALKLFAERRWVRLHRLGIEIIDPQALEQLATG